MRNSNVSAIAVTAALLSVLTGCYAHRRGGGGYGGPGYGPPPAGPGYGGVGWYGMAGCGLGALVFGPNNNPTAQVLAATTNTSTATQTFGISSGTSNCFAGGVVRAEREQAAFAEVNFIDLKRDMAAGGGEYLRSFSALLGCDGAAQPALFKMTQEQFGAILPSERSGPMQLVAGVKDRIRSDPALASACSDERAVARAQRASASAMNASAVGRS